MNGLLAAHECSPAHRVYFDPTASDQPSSAIIGALTTVTDSSPLEVTPLYETIDLDALERLLDHAATSTTPGSIAFEFTVDDWDVVVTGDGQIAVYDGERDGEDDSESDTGVEFEFDQ